MQLHSDICEGPLALGKGAGLAILAFVLAGSAPTSAWAQTGNNSRDITAPITGSGNQLRQQIRQRRADEQGEETRDAQESSEGTGGVTVTVSRDGALQGNLEIRTELEQEFFTGNSLIQLGRYKQVFLQGNVHTPMLPEIYVFVHLAREWLYDGAVFDEVQDRSNMIIEINPRWQRAFGSGLYGVEVSYGSEGRYELTRVRLRPFISYDLSRDCRVFGSINLGYTFLELNGNEPDFAYGSVEPGFSCFVGDMTILGMFSRLQYGMNLNDDDGAFNLDGSPVASFGITKEAVEWRLSPFLHHRFRSGLGATLWGEVGRITDDARNDNFFYEDFWQRLVLFLEYPVVPNLIVYLEGNARRGNRLLANPSLLAEAFALQEDFDYFAAMGTVGFNFIF